MFLTCETHSVLIILISNNYNGKRRVLNGKRRSRYNRKETRKNVCT